MPDIQNSSKRDFSVYDLMSDEELEKLLRDDFSKPTGEEADTEKLLYITTVLAERKGNTGKSPAQAWESFKQHYGTENNCICISENVPASQNKRSARWKWGLGATAAVLALVIGTSVTAGAFKFDILAPVATWTSESFYFSSEDPLVPTAIPQNVNRWDLLPTWIPEGYVLIDTCTTPSCLRNGITLTYMKDNQFLCVQVVDYSSSVSGFYEKDDSPVKVYRSNGIDYYFFTNGKRRTAVWITQNQQCSITGPLSEEEIKKMIDSVGKDG